MVKNGFDISDISLMILTHSHPDHVGSAKSIQKVFGCKAAAHASEKLGIEDVYIQYQKRPVPNFYSLVEGSVMIERVLEEIDSLDLGKIQLEIIHNQGHSSGSISINIREDKVLITKDAIPIKGYLPIYEDYTTSTIY